MFIQKMDIIYDAKERVLVSSQDVWPDYFPEKCPPEDAKNLDIVAYRCIDGNKITKGDFVPHKLKLPKKKFGRKNCQACGVSLYLSKDDCLELIRTIPRFSNSRIACGKIPRSAGVSKDTPVNNNTHLTLWPYPNVDLCAYFTLSEDDHYE